ncbi:cytochrome P450 [Sistotremastrum suecicum HHB10207 ss-3]|uniref:Cytochrome P450 n=1 Tax=Sistotremastrum suecicum HHB10207 ss-3 TaxID=1314776 RepID=A0A166DZ46_9AGAM|nr:cytochrome P450 [Sistotremastrum suecicum HHB10207 ss-3]
MSLLQNVLENALLHPWITSFVFAVFYASIKGYWKRRKAWVDVPTVGPTGIFSSYLGVWKYIRNGDEVLREGYEKYGKTGMFQVADLSRWTVVVTSVEMIQELVRVPDEILSFVQASNELIQGDWTMGPNIHANDYHVPILRSTFTRNLGFLYPEIIAEVEAAMNSALPDRPGEWVALQGTYGAMINCIARVANRVFVGAPLCQDPEYVALGIRYATDVVLGAQVIRLFPDFLKPLVGRMFTRVGSTTRQALKQLKPIIESRYAAMEERGEKYEDKPKDILQLLMDDAVGIERTAENLTRRILILNFAAIHTTSMSLTHALFSLAAAPEYIGPLREEIEKAVDEHGWTKTMLAKCRKLDSFVKESQRLRGAGTLTMARIALQDYTFSNGTFIPKGTVLNVISTARHADPELYGETAVDFDPFRYSVMREADGEGTKHHMVTPSIDYLPFGFGRHACPGRFFAVTAMKSMMAYIMLNYDVKFASGKRPADRAIASLCLPDSSAEVLFRKRSIASST